MKRWVLVVGALLLWGALSETRAEHLPRSLERQVLAVMAGPGPHGITYCEKPVAEVPYSAVRTIDFNDDGTPDYIVEFGEFQLVR